MTEPSATDDAPLRGTVIRTEGPEYVVAIHGRPAGEPLQCVLAGKRFAVGRPVVGDHVRVQTVERRSDLRAVDDSRDVIVDVEPRRTVLERAAPAGRRGTRVLVANIDTLVVVAAAAQPPLRPGLIDRYIVVAEQQGMTPLLCFNKWELADDEAREIVDHYATLGYPWVTTSAAHNDGIDDLLAALRERQSAFVGHSGVGKSSLMQRIFPDHEFAVGAVNAHSGRGRHTTTHASLLPLPEGHGPGFVVDTPGIREFGVVGVEPELLATLYVDFEPFVETCRFSPCTHTHEPGCGVKQAVESGELGALRYENYVRLYDELREAQALRERRP